jgi:hypothetical protein
MAPAGAPPIGASGSVVPPVDVPVPGKIGAPDGAGPQDQVGVGVAPDAPPFQSSG